MKALLRWWTVAGGIGGLVVAVWLLAERDQLADHPGRYFWLFLALLLLHHFEEVVFPGGIQRWLNQTIFRSADPDSPFTDGRGVRE